MESRGSDVRRDIGPLGSSKAFNIKSFTVSSSKTLNNVLSRHYIVSSNSYMLLAYVAAPDLPGVTFALLRCLQAMLSNLLFHFINSPLPTSLGVICSAYLHLHCVSLACRKSWSYLAVLRRFSPLWAFALVRFFKHRSCLTLNSAWSSASLPSCDKRAVHAPPLHSYC